MKKTMIAAAALLAALCLGGCSAGDYKNAQKLYDSGEYQAAAEAFEQLGDYKDSQERTRDCFYQEALELEDNEAYEEAGDLFEKLGEYEDAREHFLACRYGLAGQLTEEEAYEEAALIYEELGDYEDAPEKLAWVQEAQILLYLPGEWQSDPVDLAAALAASLDSELAGSSDRSFSDYIGSDPVELTFTLILEEDGSAELTTDMEVVLSGIDTVMEKIGEAIPAYMEDYLADYFEAYDYTLEDAYKLYGVENMEGLLEIAFGMPYEEFWQQIKEGLLEQAGLTDLTDDTIRQGSWSYEEGCFSFSAETASYDNAAQTITLFTEEEPFGQVTFRKVQ